MYYAGNLNLAARGYDGAQRPDRRLDTRLSIPWRLSTLSMRWERSIPPSFRHRSSFERCFDAALYQKSVQEQRYYAR